MHVALTLEVSRMLAQRSDLLAHFADYMCCDGAYLKHTHQRVPLWVQTAIAPVSTLLTKHKLSIRPITDMSIQFIS